MSATVTLIASLDAEEKSRLAWEFVQHKLRQGEGLKLTLHWALRNGFILPDDREFRAWFVDALEGKHNPERGRGRPRKQERWSMARAAMERGIAETYFRWLADFQRDRERAWLRAEGHRLRQSYPDADAWGQIFDTYTNEGRRSFEAALKGLGARSCPPTVRGGEPARELALAATTEEYSPRWESLEGKRLTRSAVERIVTRAKKPK